MQNNKIKKQIKQFLSILKGKAISKLSIAEIEHAEIISFDVFDTLVVRSVGEPTEVFDLVEEAYNNQNPTHMITGFREKRIAAERRKREIAGSKEIVLDDIYEELESTYGRDYGKLAEYEMRVELDVCFPNKEMQDFYHRMQRSGKRLIIVSDMYLPEQIIKEILCRCGYGGYERIFVSSEYGIMKRDGRLFEQVIRACKVEADCMLHIGDHPISDDIMPRKNGLRTFLYRRNKDWRKHGDGTIS